MRLRLIRDNTNIQFFAKSNIFIIISVLLIITSIGLYFAKGLNYGIDFKGGTVISTETTELVPVGDYRAALEGMGLGDVVVSELKTPAEALKGETGHAMMIRIEQQDDGAETQEAAIRSVKSRLVEVFPDIRFQSTESVGSKVSGELVKKGIIAVSLSTVLMLIYIWMRFEWQFSVGAVASLIHDVILTFGVFSLFQLEFNLSIIAAILTIVGYSINDTVVVFDRIRENLRKYKTTALADVFNLSVNETLSRTVMTSLTTLIALFALFFLGGDVIRGFTFAMIWGIFVGTYSSIFIASKIVLWLGINRDEKPKSGAGTQFAEIDA